MKKFAAVVSLVVCLFVTFNAEASGFRKDADVFIINTSAALEEGLPVNPCWIYEFTMISDDTIVNGDDTTPAQIPGLIIGVVEPRSNSVVYLSRAGENYVYYAKRSIRKTETPEKLRENSERDKSQIIRDLEKANVEASIDIEVTDTSATLIIKGKEDLKAFILEGFDGAF